INKAQPRRSPPTGSRCEGGNRPSPRPGADPRGRHRTARPDPVSPCSSRGAPSPPLPPPSTIPSGGSFPSRRKVALFGPGRGPSCCRTKTSGLIRSYLCCY
ncbi:unnamed protein product, partial [Musa acuminata subsp. burmannicoides]